MYAQFDAGNGRRRGDDSLPAMPVWQEAGERRVHEEDGKTDRSDVEMGQLHGEKEREARQPMLAPSQHQVPVAPGFQEVDAANHSNGELGQRYAQGQGQGYGQGYVAYKPFAQGYRPYGEYSPQAEKGQAGGKS